MVLGLTWPFRVRMVVVSNSERLLVVRCLAELCLPLFACLLTMTTGDRPGLRPCKKGTQRRKRRKKALEDVGHVDGETETRFRPNVMVLAVAAARR